MSLFEELLQAFGPKIQAVDVPELGGGKQVWVRALNGADFLAMAAGIRELQGNPIEIARQRAAVSLLGYLCESDGKPALASMEQAQQLLQALPFPVLNRIIIAGQKLNALDEDAPERLEKN